MNVHVVHEPLRCGNRVIVYILDRYTQYTNIIYPIISLRRSRRSCYYLIFINNNNICSWSGMLGCCTVACLEDADAVRIFYFFFFFNNLYLYLYLY